MQEQYNRFVGETQQLNPMGKKAYRSLFSSKQKHMGQTGLKGQVSYNGQMGKLDQMYKMPYKFD